VFLTYHLLSPFLTNHSVPGWGEDPIFCAFTLKEVSRKFAEGWTPLGDEFWNIRMYYPSTKVLAFSDPLILPGFLLFLAQKVGLPMFLSINMIFCLFIISGWLSATLFFCSFGIEKKLAATGGWLWAFSSHLLSQSAHFQNTLAFGIPLSLSGMMLMSSEKKGGSAAFCGGLLILGCSNLYYLYFTLLTSGILWALLLLVESSGPQRLRLLWRYPLLLCGTLITLSPILYRYFEVKGIYGAALTSRPFWLQQHFAARPKDYFTSNLVSPLYSAYTAISDNFERNAFPGLISLLLAFLGLLIALIQLPKWMRGQLPVGVVKLPVVGIAFVIAGALLSSGPLLLPSGYEWLRAHLPGFADIRAVGRFGILVVLGETCLIVYGIDTLRRCSMLPGIRVLVNFGLTLAVLLQIAERIVPQYRTWQVAVDPDHETTAILAAIAAQPSQGPLLEIGFDESQAVHVNALRRALHHEVPVLNGYSGFEPQGYALRSLASSDQGCDILMHDYWSLLKSSGLLLVKGKDSEETKRVGQCLQNVGLSLVARGDGQNGMAWLLLCNSETNRKKFA
jgi:hypothetical protein